ncbi:hypothetical protein CVT26_006449 [Gymnopilus dilepis]|uniref:Uncharacterized protein n=1 Tax=Gymnopilus dilepis TaxID=231916 RepID=A0A409Y1U1_9AGAR|nr:hypothetical protein CVT26_006449 [Gymnopilus dilepis]
MDKKLRFIKYVAVYFHQACKEGRLDEFLGRAGQTYVAMWPDSTEDVPDWFGRQVAMGAIDTAKLQLQPQIHWENDLHRIDMLIFNSRLQGIFDSLREYQSI